MWKGGMCVRKVAVALAGMVLMPGCARDAFAPYFAHPLPPTYQAAPGVRPANVSRWWTRFASPELDALIAAANFDNLDIAVAVAQLRQAEAQVRITGAALWPALSYGDASSRSQVSGTNAPGVIALPTIRDSYSKALNASYTLDVWGQNRDALEAAIRTKAASAYQVEVVRLTTYAAAVNDFLVYAANYERAKVAKNNAADAERILGVIGQRRAVGTAADLDIAQQKSLVEIQRANIPPLVQAAENARIALAVLLGRPAQSVQLATRSLGRLRLPVVSPGIPATLLLRPESGIYSIAAGVTQPIFDGDRLRGQLALSVADRQQLLEAYRKSIVQALSDVETALIAMRENAARERAQRLGVAEAKRAFALSELKLREGTIDLQTLLNTQITLFQAQDTLIQIRLARLQAAAALYQALGGDWEETPAMSPLQ